jgi:rare lipoprotein A (peptidoglycan hydrolase)
VLPRFKLAQLMWVMFLICAVSIFGSDNAEAEQELASWYGPGLQGKPTADGATFNPNGYTTASKTLPMGTELTVGYKGKSIPVTVNDRIPVSSDRDLDLSQRAAQAIGLIQPGVDYVQVSCADGGDYPNCSPPPHEETTQGDTIVQGNPISQDDNTLQGNTTFQDNPAFQSDTTLQGNPVVQGDTTLQGAPTFQGSTTFQNDPTIQGNGTPTSQGNPVVQGGASGGLHMVQPGKTLSGIAAELGTRLSTWQCTTALPIRISSTAARRYSTKG